MTTVEKEMTQGKEAKPRMPAAADEEMYQLKTMCLSKRAVRMPNKEEHATLLFYGLGARRWEIGLNCNSSSFKQAILNIYPRLRSSNGYTLWTLAQDKTTFIKIPEKVNTPRRICGYLGAQSTGCLIVVPISDIRLMGEKSNGHAGIEESSAAAAASSAAYRLEPLLSSVLPLPALPSFTVTQPAFSTHHHLSDELNQRSDPRHPLRPHPHRPQPYHLPSHLLSPIKTASRPTVLKNTERTLRSLCLMCGKMERTAGTGSFHNILTEKIPCSDGEVNIAKKLNEILGINVQSQQRKKLLASEEICKKCLRLVTDMLRIEEALRNCKERLVSSFFSTMARLRKNQDNIDEDDEAVYSESSDVIQRHASKSSNHAPAPAYLGLSDYGGSEAGSSGNSSTSSSQDKHEYAPIYPLQTYFPAALGAYHAPSQAFPGTSATYFERGGGGETFPGGSAKTYLGPSETYLGPSGPYGENGSRKRSPRNSEVSPRAFDEASFSSTQSHRSWSSNPVLSKAQQKEYPEINSTSNGYQDDAKTKEEHKTEVPEDLSMETAENLSTGAADNLSTGAASNVSIEAASNLSIEAAENLSPGASDKLSIETAEDLSIETADRLSTESSSETKDTAAAIDLKLSTGSDRSNSSAAQLAGKGCSENPGPLKKRKWTQETIKEAKANLEVEDKRIKVEADDTASNTEDLRENDLYELD